MNVFSAVEFIDGQPKPRRAYGVEMLVPNKQPSLYALSFDKYAIEMYLKACQQTTKPEHWRIVELEVKQ